MRAVLLLLLLTSGCATVPQHAASDPASLGTWCGQVGAAMCRALADRCFSGMSGVAEGCNDTIVGPCLAGRAAETPSGRSFGELDQCVAQIRSLSCEGLGAGLGSGALAQPCSARAP